MTRALPVDTWEGASVEAWSALWRVPELHVFRRVSSTNDVLRQRAEEGAASGAVALADEQTAGRGRAGKRWHAPAGTALLLSILLRPRSAPEQDTAPGTAPLRIGLAAARAIERFARARVDVKWPNDLMLAGGKLAGILCEGAVDAPDGTYVVAGIGVNVSQRAASWPPEVQRYATSLLIATGRQIARAELAGTIIDEVLRIADTVTAPLPDPVLRELAGRDVLRGRHVTVDGQRRGVAAGIARDGALLIRGNGLETHLRSGTVRLADAAEPAGGSRP